MAGCVAYGALLLVMAGAALCYPFRQDVHPRSVPSSHLRPRTLSNQAPMPPAVQEDPSHSDFAVWAYGNEQQPAAGGAQHFPNAAVLGEKPDPSGGVAVAESEVSGSLTPGVSSFVPIPPQHEFQPGELFRLEKTFEHGDYESERETQGVPQHPRPLPGPLPIALDVAEPGGVAPFPPDFFPPPVGRPYMPYPFDYYFLTGQYPPGTATHFSSSFERGRNYNQDLHYEKYEEDEPVWPWAYSGPPQNPEPAGSDARVSYLDPAAPSDYYRPYNQPGEVKLPPRYYSTYNHAGHVKRPPPPYYHKRVVH
ncbi:uncharacterized protein LOC144039615 [Vanacampus margaritifer]